MATECRKKKRRISRLTINKIKVFSFLLIILLVGLIIGMFLEAFLLRNEVKTETIIKTVEVPAYQTNELPNESELIYFDIPLSHNLQKYIYEICADEDVPMSLVMALIEQESEFNPECVSDTNDYGLMQINEINHTMLDEAYRTADMLNPYQNVYCGVKILSSYLHKYEDKTFALMAYNLGEYGALGAFESGIYSTSYTESVLNLEQIYEAKMNEQ